jgi:hypothetical protein
MTAQDFSLRVRIHKEHAALSKHEGVEAHVNGAHVRWTSAGQGTFYWKKRVPGWCWSLFTADIISNTCSNHLLVALTMACEDNRTVICCVYIDTPAAEGPARPANSYTS